MNYNIRIVKELHHRLLNQTSPERDDQEIEHVGFDLTAPLNPTTHWSPLHMACSTPSLSIITELASPGAIKAIQLDQSMRTPAQYVEQGYIGSKKASLKAEKDCYKRLLAVVNKPRLPKNLKLESRRKIELFPKKEEPKPTHPSMNRSIGQISARSRDASQNPDPTSNVVLNESINKQTLFQVKKNNSELNNGENILQDFHSGLSNDLDKKNPGGREPRYLSGIDNNYLRPDNERNYLGVPGSTKTLLVGDGHQHSAKKIMFDTSIDGPLGEDTDRRSHAKPLSGVGSPPTGHTKNDSQADFTKNLLSQQQNSNIAALVSSFYHKAALPLREANGRRKSQALQPNGSLKESEFLDDASLRPGAYSAVEELENDRDKPHSRIKPYIESGTGLSQYTRTELRKESGVSSKFPGSPPGPRFKSENPVPSRPYTQDSNQQDSSHKPLSNSRVHQVLQGTNEVEHPHQSRQPNRGSLYMRPDFNKLARAKPSLPIQQKPLEAAQKESDNPTFKPTKEINLPRLDVLEMRLVKACTRLATEVESACKKMSKLAAMARFVTGISESSLSSVVIKVAQITRLLSLRSIEMEWTGQFEKIGASKMELPSRQLEEVDKMLGGALLSLGTIAVSLMKSKPPPMPLIQSIFMISYALLSGTGEFQFLMGSVAGFFRSLHPTFRKFDLSPQPRLGTTAPINERIGDGRLTKQILMPMEKLIGVLTCYFGRLVLHNTASITMGSINYIRKQEAEEDQGALRELQHTTSIGCPSPMFGLKTPMQAAIRKKPSRERLMSYTGQNPNTLMMFRNITGKKERTNSTVQIKPKAP